MQPGIGYIRPSVVLIISLLYLSLPSINPEPSKADIASLKCLEKGLLAIDFRGASKTKFLDNAPRPAAVKREYCTSSESDTPMLAAFFNKPDAITGVATFANLCVSMPVNGYYRRLGVKDIMKATEKCKSIGGETAYACSLQLLSQPAIERMGVLGISEFIRYITPDLPICDEETFSDEYVPATTKVAGPLKAMKIVLGTCISEAINSNFKDDSKKSAKSKMDVGMKAFFGCNWFVRAVNQPRNRDSQNNDIVKQSWITDCMRKGLPIQEGTGIDPEQFQQVFGSSDHEETVNELNNMIQGIRCATESDQGAPDIYTHLRTLGGPFAKRAIATYDKIEQYVSCFKKVFKETKDVKFGDLVGCSEGVGIYEKTTDCTSAKARSMDGPFKLNLPAKDTELKKLVRKNKAGKWLHEKICKFLGPWKWGDGGTGDENDEMDAITGIAAAVVLVACMIGLCFLLNYSIEAGILVILGMLVVGWMIEGAKVNAEADKRRS